MSIDIKTLALAKSYADKVAGVMKYVDATKVPIPETASIGQVLSVKSVDENGKPTEWNTADIPTAVTDDHINSLIDAKLGVIENGSY